MLCTARPPAASTSASGHTDTQVAHRRAQVPGAIVVCVVRHQQHAQRQLVWQVQQGEGAVVVVQLQRRHPQGLQAGRRGRQAGGASIVKGLVPAAWKPACPACCVASRLASLDPCLSRLGQPAPAAVPPPPPPPPPPSGQHVSAAYRCRTSEARLHHMCHRLVKDGEKGQLLVFAAAGKATGVGVAGYSSSSVVGG